MFERFFKKNSNPVLFWEWFSKNADLYYHFESNQSILFSQLKQKLNNINKDLVFEFSPILKDNTREFIISADGIQSAFPAVIDLVTKAPTIRNWEIVAFRQPRPNITHIHFERLVIDLNEVFFRYAKDQLGISLELFFKHYEDSQEWSVAPFILLDNLIGEYDTEMSLTYIQSQLLHEAEIKSLLPIKLLPNIVKDLKAAINN